MAIRHSTFDILRAARVFNAIFPKPCECVLFQNSDAKESSLPYKSSANVLLDSWRSNGVINFRENDADRSNYVFTVFSNAFYALYKDIDAVYRCLLFLRDRLRTRRGGIFTLKMTTASTNRSRGG